MPCRCAACRSTQPMHTSSGSAELGHRVAICEQVEDPRELGGRRLVRREVVEVVTPGLVGRSRRASTAARSWRSSALDLPDPPVAGESLLAVPRRFGLAVLEASTGDFRATELVVESAAAGERSGCFRTRSLEELSRIAPREMLVPGVGPRGSRRELESALGTVVVTASSAAAFESLRSPVTWQGMEQTGGDTGSRAARAVANYLAENQPFAALQPPRAMRDMRSRTPSSSTRRRAATSSSSRTARTAVAAAR